MQQCLSHVLFGGVESRVGSSSSGDRVTTFTGPFTQLKAKTAMNLSALLPAPPWKNERIKSD